MPPLPPLPPDDSEGNAGEVPTEVQTITNLLTDPCLSGVANNIIESGLANKVVSKMNAIFGFNDKTNLIFKDMSQYLIDGPQRAPLGSTTMGATIVGRHGNGVIDVTIYVNELQRESGTEFTSATIIHEIEHAILGWNGFTTETQEHNLMLKTYYGESAALLQSIYPGLADYDAKSIIWAGLWDTIYGAALQSIFPSDANAMIELSLKYYRGEKGTKCN